MSMIENTDELIERLRDADASGSRSPIPGSRFDTEPA